jgi:hypothetical protein
MKPLPPMESGRSFSYRADDIDTPMHAYEVRPRKDKRNLALISDVLPFGRLWYGEPDATTNAIGYTKFFSRSHDALIRVYDESGNVITTQEEAGEFKEP